MKKKAEEEGGRGGGGGEGRRRRRKRERKEKKTQRKTVYNKMALHTYLSIITLNVNGLNAPIKRHRVAEWIRKQNQHTCCLQETHLKKKKKKSKHTESKGLEKIFHVNGNEIKLVAILLSDKIDFKTKAIQ